MDYFQIIQVQVVWYQPQIDFFSYCNLLPQKSFILLIVQKSSNDLQI